MRQSSVAKSTWNKLLSTCSRITSKWKAYHPISTWNRLSCQTNKQKVTMQIKKQRSLSLYLRILLSLGTKACPWRRVSWPPTAVKLGHRKVTINGGRKYSNYAEFHQWAGKKELRVVTQCSGAATLKSFPSSTNAIDCCGLTKLKRPDMRSFQRTTDSELVRDGAATGLPGFDTRLKTLIEKELQHRCMADPRFPLWETVLGTDLQWFHICLCLALICDTHKATE